MSNLVRLFISLKDYIKYKNGSRLMGQKIINNKIVTLYKH